MEEIFKMLHILSWKKDDISHIIVRGTAVYRASSSLIRMSLEITTLVPPKVAVSAPDPREQFFDFDIIFFYRIHFIFFW